jgi:heat shock protein HtpX
MSWFKRIFLFAVVNLLILVTISIVLNLLGVQPYLTAYGIDYRQLMIFCLVWGMGGAFISLSLSRIMAKWMMGVQVIDPQTNQPELAGLVNLVHSLAQRANLPCMPEVGFYESDEVNAFATGPTKARALVAVSTGLLQSMDRDQVEGVLGHEITHVANGDMVTMTLLQGIINAFVMFFARVIAFAVSQALRQENRRMITYLLTVVLEIALSILGFMVVAAFSRWREFRADHGGAELAGRQKMIDALRALQRNLSLQHPGEAPSIATLKISGKQGGFMALMATHPPLEERIQRLQEYR